MARKSKSSVAVAEPQQTHEERAIEVEDIAITEAQALDEAEAAEATTARQTVTARCQEAKESGACACRCRGKYHGKEHPVGWKDEEGCEPLTKEERKLAHKDTLNAWRRAHPDRVSTYMMKWRATSNAATAVAHRAAAAKRAEATRDTTQDPVDNTTQ